MSNALLLIAYFGVLLAMTKPVGLFMARVFSGERTVLHPVVAPVERGIYRLTGVDETKEMRWTTYAVAMLLFNLAGFLVVYLLQRLQRGLPLNPRELSGIEPRSAFNTAVSFVTNTNWQGYYPEITMGYLTQMSGLTVQNFVSAATGIAVAIALVRGFARRSSREIGNFWVDLTRATLYVLLPLSIVMAVFLVARGVPQNLNDYTAAVGLGGETVLIPQGPVASQEAPKMIGTNGGGFFNANSAHPYENPTPLTNFVQMVAIFLIPAGLTYTFGRMVGNTKQGWAIFAAMSALFFVGVAVTTVAEQSGNPLLTDAGASQETTVNGESTPGGNMESKETRFGIAASSLFAVITTAASCGAVNAMHDSFTPLGGMVPLANIGLGEVIFGGVGAGLYGILVYSVLAIFIAGLMVGRTPEYLGKKIEPYDVKMAMLVTLVLPLSILGFTGVAMATDEALASRWNPAAHGLSEILYAFTSATGNNGSAFAGISANTPFFNPTLGMAMLIGRFLMIVPILALAGNLAHKQRATVTAGTFPTTGPLWIGLLVGVILIVGALTYFPAYTLGPVVEHFQMRNGITFSLE
ncbi:MAG: Potassium-transporting ATPase A chain [uncultured Thermomicrobiales bacterium]|uniref:Potassium-transporting ATPase potassium-binding subunit n=1 Tax=uncultured Thermomicrobiales bacterium TaxID=1645740 RepID=A0A6J4U480_9BACT|nr:MAG: Potassium-transporting ATPase A chain [uncultured Thermomicrobiales bacterium]